MTGPIVLVPGHRPSAPGATSPDGKVSEYAWCSAHVRRVANALARRDVPFVVVERDDRPGAYRDLPDKINAAAPRAAAVALFHFDSLRGSSATGSTAFHFAGSVWGQRLAELQAEADDVLDLPNRGPGGVRAKGWQIVLRSEEDGPRLIRWGLQRREAELVAAKMAGIVDVEMTRGTWALWKTWAPAVLIEPFFGSNPRDWQRANECADELAEAQADAFVAFLDERRFAAAQPS